MPNAEPPDGDAITSALHGAPGPAGEEPAPGAKIGGRYRIERELSRGGVGAVWLARDEELNARPVVVKVLLEQAQVYQEREALARLDHPGIVGVLDTGELPDGKPYLVTQYVDGVTLRQLIERGPVAPRRAAKIFRQIGRALTAAHEKGVYHKDLKPENILLQDLGGGQEAIKIIDFGIATLRVAGPSSDLFSFAIVAYEMLTGKMYARQQEGVKVRPEEVRQDLTGAARDCILKVLELDAGRRFGSAREFGEALAGALEKRREEARAGSRRRAVAWVAVGVGLVAMLPMVVSSLRAPERTFHYSIVAQRTSRGQPWGQPFELPGEMIFQSDFQLKLRVSAPEAGYLYVFGGDRQFVASARLGANQAVDVPGDRWMSFGEAAGVERIWLVWSESAMADARALLGGPQAAAARDEAGRRTVVRGRGRTLVRLVELEHH